MKKYRPFISISTPVDMVSRLEQLHKFSKVEFIKVEEELNERAVEELYKLYQEDGVSDLYVVSLESFNEFIKTMLPLYINNDLKEWKDNRNFNNMNEALIMYEKMEKLINIFKRCNILLRKEDYSNDELNILEELLYG